jgi:cell division septal protein FtsQ
MARIDRLPWRVLAGLALTLIGLSLGFLWFRDSSFAAVKHVSIVGNTSSEEAQVREALEATAAGMSTLNVDTEALEQSVEPYASVADLHVKSSFPHDLEIEVVEHRPVANIESGGSRIPVTGGGLVLDGVRSEDLPLVQSKGPLTDGRVQDRKALGALRVAAAAPAQLRGRAERVQWGDDGIAVDLRSGPDLIFGDASDAREKWRAAARVPEPTPAPTVVPSEPQP